MKTAAITPRSLVLILGASCVIGRGLHRALDRHRSVATFRRRRIAGGVYFELPGMELSGTIAHPERFSHAVILLAETDPEICYSDPTATSAVNVEATKRTVDWLWGRGIIPVFASSRAVFDGEAGDYTEEDPVRPITEYGRQKRCVERYLEASGAPHVILRLSSVVGTEPGDGTLFTNWLADVERGEPIRCASDQRFSPVLIDDVIAAFAAAIDTDLRGLFHVAGPTAMTRIEMLRLLIKELRRYGPCKPRVEACRLCDFPTAERRALDTSMQSLKLTAATGLKFTPAADICAAVARNASRQSAAPIPLTRA